MKKLIASLIVSLLLLSVCFVAAMPASAAEGVNYDDWLIYDGAIVEYCGSDAEVVVPTVDADGLPITRIEGSAFAGTEQTHNTTLEKVVIPEGITEIGGSAFQFCEALVEVSLPYSLEKVGHSLFRYCNLTEIKIPGNLKEIPSDFTTGCPIAEYVISHGVEVFQHGSITVGAGCEEIIFPKSVYEIQGRAACYLKQDAGKVGDGRLEFYITNDECMVGKSDGSEQWYKRWNGAERGAIFEVPTNFSYDPVWYSKFTQMHIYGLEDGKIGQYVKDYMSNSDKPWEYAVFHGMSKEELDEKAQFCKDNAVPKPDETTNKNEDNDKDNKNDNDDDDNNSSSNKNNVSQSGGIDTTTLIIIIAVAGGFLLLIIVAVVIVVVVMSSKKKKKKKKKAKVEAPIEEAPVEEAVPVEEVAEEKGEEE